MTIKDLNEKVNDLEEKIDCDTHTEAINNLKMDMINIKNVSIPNFKKEVTDMIDKSLEAMNVQVQAVQDKISKFTWSLIIGCIITPFAIVLINRYLPKLLDWMRI